MVLHEYAIHNEELIHIKSVSDKDRLNVYTCPDCDERLSFKLFRTRNASHFVHKTDNVCSGGNGGGEGELHNAFKNAVFYMLNEARNNELPFHVTKICRCSESVEVDLLDDCTEIRMEKYIADGYCPDITIKGTTRDTVIEVVVTHRPEPHCYEYIEQNDVRAVIIEVTDEVKKSLDDTKKMTQSRENHIEILNCDEWNNCESCVEWARKIKENTIRRAKEAELARIEDVRIRKIREKQIEATRIAREARIEKEKKAAEEQRKKDIIKHNIQAKKNRLKREETDLISREKRNRQNALHDAERLREYEKEQERETNARERGAKERNDRVAHCMSSEYLKNCATTHAEHSKMMLSVAPPDGCTNVYKYCIECPLILICDKIQITTDIRDHLTGNNSLYYTKG